MARHDKRFDTKHGVSGKCSISCKGSGISAYSPTMVLDKIQRNTTTASVSVCSEGLDRGDVS